MSDNRDVQDWFNRSVEELPSQPFTLSVMQQVQRSERRQWLLRSVPWVVAAFSLCLLLPELIALLNTLAALPSVLIAAFGEQWPLLTLVVMGLAWWFFNYVRNAGFFRGG